jgi:hypothetical protein
MFCRHCLPALHCYVHASLFLRDATLRVLSRRLGMLCFHVHSFDHTRCFSRSTAVTKPVLLRSSPAITFTVSPVLMPRFTFCLCSIHITIPLEPVIHLMNASRAAHVPQVRKYGASWLIVGIKQYSSIIIKADVRTIFSANFLRTRTTTALTLFLFYVARRKRDFTVTTICRLRKHISIGAA